MLFLKCLRNVNYSASRLENWERIWWYLKYATDEIHAIDAKNQTLFILLIYNICCLPSRFTFVLSLFLSISCTLFLCQNIEKDNLHPCYFHWKEQFHLTDTQNKMNRPTTCKTVVIPVVCLRMPIPNSNHMPWELLEKPKGRKKRKKTRKFYFDHREESMIFLDKWARKKR